MVTRLRRWCLQLLRRTVGTAQLLEHQQIADARNERRHQHQKRALIALGNAVTYAAAAGAQLAGSTAYRRCSQIIRRLEPRDVEGGQYVRLGRKNDGGYVMLNGFSSGSVDAALSFGIGNDASWDRAIGDRGIPVLMFDHTIERAPIAHPNCRHIRTGVTGHKAVARRRTLPELIAEGGRAESRRLLLKMDVEGAEWDVFDQAPAAVLDQFSQMVIEFHHLTLAVHDERPLARVLRVLDKLNQTHQCVHVHANTNVSRMPVWIGRLVLPDALEVTYVRRTEFAGRLRPCTRQFPTPIDQPSVAGDPELYLGTFSIGETSDSG